MMGMNALNAPGSKPHPLVSALLRFLMSESE
jgi:hypothetical protein